MSRKARQGEFHASTRQVEILRLEAAGRSDKQIAAYLQLSTATIRTYLHRLYRDN